MHYTFHRLSSSPVDKNNLCNMLILPGSPLVECGNRVHNTHCAERQHAYSLCFLFANCNYFPFEGDQCSGSYLTCILTKISGTLA